MRLRVVERITPDMITTPIVSRNRGLGSWSSPRAIVRARVRLMSVGIWPEWMVYTPPSAVALGAAQGRGNVIRDVTREILSAISGLTLLGPKDGVVWRGQADVSWRLESRMGRLGMTPREMTAQERLMIRKAREIGADNAQHLGDWEILARLRHHGAATRLIDFTTDPLVALWFLCDDDVPTEGPNGSSTTLRRRPGVILALQRESLGEVPAPYARGNYSRTLDKPANLLYKIPPIDPRIAAQRGVFAFSTDPKTNGQCDASELGLPSPPSTWIPNHKERLARVCDTEKWQTRVGRPIEKFPTIIGIEVPALVKDQLLAVLRTAYGFSWSTMFPDFAGMGRAYSGRVVRAKP